MFTVNITDKPKKDDTKHDAFIFLLQQALHPNESSAPTTTAGCGDGKSGGGRFSSNVSWSSLLQGLSQAIPKSADDESSARWSAGIDQVQGLDS